MADVLPLPVARTGESAQVLLLEQRDVLERVENVLERSHVRLEVIQDVVSQTLGVQKEQLEMFRKQLENQEFANEEARREAARMRAGGGIGPSGATAQVEDSVSRSSFIEGAAQAALGGIAGGLAAGGLTAALRGLAGRVIRGGGLIGIGTIFGEQIGRFLGTEASAILGDLGVDPQFADEVGSAIRNNTQSALVGGGLSRILLGRTLPGIIGGIIFNQLDLGRIFTPEGREDLENGIRDWFERLRDGELTNEDIVNGAIVGGAAAYGARQLQRGGQAIGRRFPTFRLDGTVEGPAQTARPGARPAPTPGTFVRPRRPSGQFMSDAEIADMERSITDARNRRVFRNLLKGLGAVGIILTIGQGLELIAILNGSGTPEEKQAAVGAFLGSFIGGMSGLAAGAYIGAFGGPWGAVIGGAIGGVAGSLGGEQIGLLIARWAWGEEPPVYQTQEQYESFIRQNRERFEAGPNAMIIPGVTVGPTGSIQRTTPSFGQQFGFSPQVETGARAQRLNEEGIELLEDAVSELKKLNENIETGPVLSGTDASSVGVGEARVFNAALGTTMTVGAPRPMQAAFTPSFGEPSVVRASLSPEGSAAGTDSMTEDQRKALMVYSAFTQAGFSDSQARALVGEVYRENGFREQYWYGTHTDPANEATNAGIISWQGPRKADLYNYLGDRGLLNADGSMKPGFDTLVAQAEFLRYEMQTGAGGGTSGQISRYQDWFRSDQVSAEESARVLGQDFIRWRMTDPEYRPSGMANIEYGRSQIDSVLAQTPDTRITGAPSGDMEAGRSILGSLGETFQSLVKATDGFGFDATFGAGTYANILTSDNPERMIADKLQSVFNRGGVGVTPAAVELNRGSERATTAPIVINAPQINNDNSVQGGGGGRVAASNERAISPITDRSLASTVSQWWDATMA